MGNATTVAQLRRVSDRLGSCSAILVPTGEMRTLPQTPLREALAWRYREPNFLSLTLALAGAPLRTRGERA
jgi:hypothetical protein